ncbi:MAG: hypothetical protein KGI37_06360 [Alphaproteobacteria bacterium]|nr:hypothetical protein [Alphaproteobacteria bacterium]
MGRYSRPKDSYPGTTALPPGLFPPPFFSSGGNIFGAPWKNHFEEARNLHLHIAPEREWIQSSRESRREAIGESFPDVRDYVVPRLISSVNAAVMLRPLWDFQSVACLPEIAADIGVLMSAITKTFDAERNGGAPAFKHVRSDFREVCEGIDGHKRRHVHLAGWYAKCQTFLAHQERRARSQKPGEEYKQAKWVYHQIVTEEPRAGGGVRKILTPQFELRCRDTEQVVFRSHIMLGRREHIAAVGVFGKLLADTVGVMRKLNYDAAHDLPIDFAAAVRALAPHLPGPEIPGVPTPLTLLNERIEIMRVAAKSIDESVLDELQQSIARLRAHFMVLGEPADRLSPVLGMPAHERHDFYKAVYAPLKKSARPGADPSLGRVPGQLSLL